MGNEHLCAFVLKWQKKAQHVGKYITCTTSTSNNNYNSGNVMHNGFKSVGELWSCLLSTNYTSFIYIYIDLEAKKQKLKKSVKAKHIH